MLSDLNERLQILPLPFCSPITSHWSISKAESKKMYVAFKGRNPALYETWEECEEQVCGFSGQMHKLYKKRADAKFAWLKYWSRNAVQGDVDDGAIDGMFLPKMHLWCISSEELKQLKPLWQTSGMLAPMLFLWLGWLCYSWCVMYSIICCSGSWPLSNSTQAVCVLVFWASLFRPVLGKQLRYLANTMWLQ